MGRRQLRTVSSNSGLYFGSMVIGLEQCVGCRRCIQKLFSVSL